MRICMYIHDGYSPFQMRCKTPLAIAELQLPQPDSFVGTASEHQSTVRGHVYAVDWSGVTVERMRSLTVRGHNVIGIKVKMSGEND